MECIPSRVTSIGVRTSGACKYKMSTEGASRAARLAAACVRTDSGVRLSPYVGNGFTFEATISLCMLSQNAHMKHAILHVPGKTKITGLRHRVMPQKRQGAHFADNTRG